MVLAEWLRMIGGQHHKVGAQHLGAYAVHAAWLEDHRDRSNGALADRLIAQLWPSRLAGAGRATGGAPQTVGRLGSAAVLTPGSLRGSRHEVRHARGTRPAFTSPTGSILQVKMRLVGISPMIWRRVLLPVAWTLEELHGVIQAAMGWEGLHLYEFRIRSARYGSPDLFTEVADVTLESLRFRRNAKVIYTYDMGDWWEHEIRIEDRLEVENGRRYPRCMGGKAPARRRTAAGRKATRHVARRR